MKKNLAKPLVVFSANTVLCCCTYNDNSLPIICQKVDLSRFDRASNLERDQKIVVDGKSVICSVPDDGARTFIQTLNEKTCNDASVFRTSAGAELKLWTSIRANDSEVIVVGGSEGQAVSNESWLVNQKTLAMRSGPILKQGRKDCALTRLRSGKILVSGGIGDRSMLDDCEILDPKNGEVVSFSKLEIPRCEHAAFEASTGDIYVIGGKNSKFELLSSIEKRDTSKNQFHAIGRMFEARYSPRIFPISSKAFLIVGGLTDDLHHMPRPEVVQND